jgi:DNA repair ATPase RecN
MTEIEMARECSTCQLGRSDNPFCSDGYHITPQWEAACNHLLSMQCDNPMKAYPTSFSYPEEVSEAAQIMRNEINALKADVAELVECLAKAFADPERLSESESAMNETAALIAKHGEPK